MGEQGFTLGIPAIAPVRPVRLGDLHDLLQKVRAEPFQLDRTGIDEAAFRAFDPGALPTAAPVLPGVMPDPVSFTDTPAPEPVAVDPGGKPTAPPAPAPPEPGYAEGWEEGHRAGRAEGQAAGQEAGRAEVQARLATALDLLAAAHARLATPSAADTAALGAAILGAVRSLAAERAGQAIDQCPVPFLRRIDRMAERIAQGAAQVEVRLNPQDLQTLTPVLAQSTHLRSARISADPGLSRGDVDLRVPGVHLADLIVPLPDEAAA